MPHQSSPRTRYRRPGRSAAVTFFPFGGAFEREGATRDCDGDQVAEPQHPRIHQRQHHEEDGFAVESSRNESGERYYRIGE